MLYREPSSMLASIPAIVACMTTIGDRIRVARLAAGFETQASLAKAIGVTKSAVNQWEAGQNANVRPDNLVAIADACGVDVTWLAVGRGPKEGLSSEDREWLQVGRNMRPRERQATREMVTALRERHENGEPAEGAG